jgi:glycosyltransferase involved in cell wall biosynthesis
MAGPDDDIIVARSAWPVRHNLLRVFLPGFQRILDAFEPTHVHVEEEPFSLMAAQMAVYANRRRIPFSFFSWENLERELPYPLRAAEALTTASATSAIAGSEGARLRLCRRLPAWTIDVVPQLGVQDPITREFPAEPLPKLRVLFAGRLVAEKGVMDLAATATLCPTAHYTFLGSGPMEAQLTAMAAYEPRIKVAGPAPHGAVEAIMRDFDVLVLPSHSTKSWSEQFGHVLIEAIASGLVAVGSSSGAIPEVVGDPRLTFHPGKISDLAAILNRLAENVGWRTRIQGRQAQRVADGFTHAAIAARTVAHLTRPGRPRVSIIPDSPAEDWRSMEIYAGELIARLTSSDRVDVRVLGYPDASLYKRLPRKFRIAVDRYLWMPTILALVNPGLRHIVDQSYAHLVSAQPGTKSIITCHDIGPLEENRRSLGVLLYRLAIGRLRLADLVLTDAESTKRTVERLLHVDPARIRTIPLGVDERFFDVTWGHGLHPLVLLHVGSNAAYKRIDIVADVAENLRRLGLNVELWKVGADTPKPIVDKLQSAGVPVKDYGFQRREMMPEIFSRASMLLFPSDREGFGLPVVEAMAVGLPVVASDIPVLREVGQDSVVFVRSRDSTAFAQAVLHLANDPVMASELSRRSRLQAERYSWTEAARSVLESYVQLSSP